MNAVKRWCVVIVVVVLPSLAVSGCGTKSGNETVFEGGAGQADPNKPQTSDEYDRKFQDPPSPTVRKKAK